MRLTYLAAALALASGPLLSQDSVAKGKTLFSKYGCYQCHGYQGQGGAAGVRLAPKPIALVSFIAYVRRPSGQMPPYTAKVVTDAELADIRAFLVSMPEPAPAKSIPLLNQ